ncbi:MAG: class I SAM-dependent methyltransferase [Actinomycetota bacterium]|nr:class I SAM-dependent methyltransferase [Actinomycetota bacterium]
MSTRASHARALFAGIAPEYEWMGGVLSFGQDPRWRRSLVSRVDAPRGASVLDVATGTGLVARALAARGYRVTGLDASERMLRSGEAAGPRIVALAEALPFGDAGFAALTFTYLLRYVDDPAATMKELARVVTPGGVVASLEFLVPEARWARTAWRPYTQYVMPLVGSIVSPEWASTGRFLSHSIEDYWRSYPLPEQVGWWEAAGIGTVHTRTMSNGAAIVTWGLKR